MQPVAGLGEMRICFWIALALFAANSAARQPVLGDEISGEAYVSWDAAIEKVSQTLPYGVSVRAKLEFEGRTNEGNLIRGTGVLRFEAGYYESFAVGDALQGSDSLRYWTTVKSVMGSDLAILEGVALLGFDTTGSVMTSDGAVDLKAALELH